MNTYFKISILFVLVLLELLSATYWQGSLSMDACRVVHFISGLGIVGLLLTRPVLYRVNSIKYQWVLFLLMLILCIWSIPKLYHLFERNPLDYTHADMLPVILVMCQRWISGLHVYSIIPEIWGGVMPVYLPAMWLPFVPAVLFDFDLRWMTTCVLLVSVLCLLLSHKSLTGGLCIFCLIGLWFDYVLHVKNETMVLSEEAIVYAYYIGLVISLVKKNIIAIAIMMGLCLMSRYGIVFYSIALSVYFLIKFNKHISLRYLIVLSVTIGILMTLASAWGDLVHFLQLSGNYLDAIALDQNKYQSVIQEGLGLSPFIGIQHFNLVYWLQIILLVLTAAGMIVFAKNKNQWYEIAFLKLTLIVFYNFIIIPYPYLMYTSVWVSIAILYFYGDPVRDKSLNLTNAPTG